MERGVLKSATFSIAVAVVSILSATVAEAHPKLLSSVPAANVTVPRASGAVLRFNERLVAKFSGVELIRTSPGQRPAKLAGVTSRVGADGKTLIVTTRAPLGAGRYRLDWHAVAADTHRIEGSFSFAVK